MAEDLESSNEIRITDIDGAVLVRIPLPSGGRVARTVQRLLDDGLIDLATGIYSLEFVIDGQLVDEIFCSRIDPFPSANTMRRTVSASPTAR